MRNLFCLSIILALSCWKCLGQENKTPHITYNDSACIKVVVDNVVDSFKLNTYSFSSFPHRFTNFKILNIAKPGVFYLSVPMSMPGLSLFYWNEIVQLFLMPGDTLTINAGFEKVGNNEPAIYFRTDDIFNDYYRAKKERFGFASFEDPAFHSTIKFNTQELSRNDFNEALLTLNYSEEQCLLFLESYNKDLPNWFIDLEKANIVYGVANYSIMLYYNLKRMDQKNNTFIKPELYNPGAIISSSYYKFLSAYFNFKFPQMDMQDRTSNSINQFRYFSNLADSILEGEAKDYFLACTLFSIYSFCITAADINKVDTFISNNFKNLGIEKMKFIHSGKNQNRKFIKSSLSKGDNAPGFFLKDVNGIPYKLDNFTGKLTYLNFWSSNNSNSVKEFQALNKLFFKLTNKPIEIINICLDDDTVRCKQIVKESELKGINLICKGNWRKVLRESYFIEELPHFALIDKNGLVIENKCTGPADIYKELQKLLQNR